MEETPNWSAQPVREISTKELDELCVKMQKEWADYEEAKKKSNELHAAYEETERKVLETLRQAGKKKYFVEGLGTISIRTKFQVKVPSSLEAKEKFFKYLSAKGKAVYFKLLTINSQTLNSYYNAELKAAQETGAGNFSIPGIDEPTHRDTIAFTKERTE